MFTDGIILKAYFLNGNIKLIILPDLLYKAIELISNIEVFKYLIIKN